MSSNSWELIEYLHPVLVRLDYTQAKVKVALIIASFLLWTTVYLLSVALASMTETYKKLRVKEKIFWNLAMVRASFGTYCIFVGVWAIFTDNVMDKDVLYGTTATGHFSLCVTVGFFIFECTALTVSDIVYRTFSLLLNLHHWLSLLGYGLVITTGIGHCFAIKGLILEMSTPFSALCWTLLKAGKERSLLWKANQFLLVHTFHVRSVVECMFWYITYHNWTYIWAEMPWPVFLALYVQLSLVSVIMTPYWTYKKTAQMINPVDWNFETTPLTNGTVTINGHTPVDDIKDNSVTSPLANGAATINGYIPAENKKDN